MIGLFEGGNSRLHSGRWNSQSVRDVVHTAYPASVDDFAVVVRDLLGASVPDRIAACSVSPRYGAVLFAALKLIVPRGVTVFRTAADLGVDVRYDQPGRYGIDRALAALAAYSRLHASCVVIDAGTAVTVDVVDDEGVVVGGYIFPGLGTLAYGLAARTGLPEVSSGVTGGLPGNSTETCIARGIAEGFAGAVGRLAGRAAGSAGSGNRILVTGGDGERLLDALPPGAEYVPDLALEGLARAAERAG